MSLSLELISKTLKGGKSVILKIEGKLVTQLEVVHGFVQRFIQALLEVFYGVGSESKGQRKDVEGVGEWSWGLSDLQVTEELLELILLRYVVVMGKCIFQQSFSHPPRPQGDNGFGLERLQPWNVVCLIDIPEAIVRRKDIAKTSISKGKR